MPWIEVTVLNGPDNKTPELINMNYVLRARAMKVHGFDATELVFIDPTKEPIHIVDRVSDIQFKIAKSRK